MARYSTEHKQETRARILKAAAKEFRSKGAAGATIPGIMETAGLTVGGFYKHFASKEELFAEMLRASLRKSTDRMQQLAAALPEESWFDVFASEYLSQAHVDNVRGGCVMAGLASDMPRASSAAGEAFDDELRQVIDALAEGLPNADRKRAIAAQALLLGGLVLARGVQNEVASEEILAACRETASELVQ